MTPLDPVLLLKSEFNLWKSNGKTGFCLENRTWKTGKSKQRTENPSKKSSKDRPCYSEKPKISCFLGPIFREKTGFSLGFSSAELRFSKWDRIQRSHSAAHLVGWLVFLSGICVLVYFSISVRYIGGFRFSGDGPRSTYVYGKNGEAGTPFPFHGPLSLCRFAIFLNIHLAASGCWRLK